TDVGGTKNFGRYLRAICNRLQGPDYGEISTFHPPAVVGFTAYAPAQPAPDPLGRRPVFCGILLACRPAVNAESVAAEARPRHRGGHRPGPGGPVVSRHARLQGSQSRGAAEWQSLRRPRDSRLRNRPRPESWRSTVNDRREVWLGSYRLLGTG